jgi:hypothetical protein
MYSRRTTQKQLENVLRLQEQHNEEMKKNTVCVMILSKITIFEHFRNK